MRREGYLISQIKSPARSANASGAVWDCISLNRPRTSQAPRAAVRPCVSAPSMLNCLILFSLHFPSHCIQCIASSVHVPRTKAGAHMSIGAGKGEEKTRKGSSFCSSCMRAQL
jgi:hypothetical protein